MKPEGDFTYPQQVLLRTIKVGRILPVGFDSAEVKLAYIDRIHHILTAIHDEPDDE